MAPPFGLFRWEELGSGFGAGHWPQSMVLDPNDDPRAASAFGDLINSSGTVSEWTAGAWQQVGRTVTAHLPSFGHSLAIGPGLLPVSVAFRWNSAGTQLSIGLSEWTGAGWADRGGPAGVQHAWDPVLIASSQGTRIVAFTEYASNLRSFQMQVHRWDGVGWSRLGGRLVSKGYTQSPSIARDANDNVYVACEWMGRAGQDPAVIVLSWDGVRWTRLGRPIPAPSRQPRIAVGSAGHIVLGFIEAAGTPAQATRCARWNGTGWQVLAPVINRAVSFSVAAEPGGTPWWPTRIRPARSNGSRWRGSGRPARPRSARRIRSAPETRARP